MHENKENKVKLFPLGVLICLLLYYDDSKCSFFTPVYI